METTKKKEKAKAKKDSLHMLTIAFYVKVFEERIEQEKRNKIVLIDQINSLTEGKDIELSNSNSI